MSGEVRGFALLGAYGEPSPHRLPEIQHVRELGYAVEHRRVTYEVLPGAGEKLAVTGP